MDFNEYQHQAMKYATFENDFYPVMALAEEAGEVSGKVAKLIRDKGLKKLSYALPEDRLAIAMELGDVLWQCQALAHVLFMNFEEIAAMNLKKLADRKKRGKLGGSGDDR